MNTISSMHTSPSYYGTTLHDKKIQNKRNKHTEQRIQNEDYNKNATPEEVRMWKTGVLLGAAIGAVTMTGGYYLYDNHEKKELIEDFKQEYMEKDTKSLKIEDINDDEMPDIIVEKHNGDQIIYDFKNNSIGIKMDDEIVEKIR